MICGMGRQGGTTEPGCPSVRGKGCIWLGTPSSCSWPSLPHCRKWWVRLFTSDLPLLVHPVKEHLHPQLPSGMDCFSIHWYQSEVAALPMGLWGHQSWCLQVRGDISPAAFLHPPCSCGCCGDTFSLLQQQRLCFIWDCIFALPTVFSHLNVYQEITLWA